MYEFDYGRGRMIGPAARITDPLGVVRVLPGYPFTFGGGATLAQDECADSSGVVVAEGAGGGVAVLPRLGNGTLAPARHWRLPNVEVHVPPQFGGGTAENRSIIGPAPEVDSVVCFDDGHAVAITREQSLGTSVGYLLDLAAGTVLGTRQLPFGQTVDAVRVGDHSFAITTNENKVAMLDAGLAVVASAPIDGRASHVVWLHGTVVVRTFEPNALEAFADTTLAPGPRASLTGDGPLSVAEPDGRVILAGDFATGAVTMFNGGLSTIGAWPACARAMAMAQYGSATLITCRTVPSQVYFVDPSDGVRRSSYGGGDPIALAQ